MQFIDFFSYWGHFLYAFCDLELFCRLIEWWLIRCGKLINCWGWWRLVWHFRDRCWAYEARILSTFLLFLWTHFVEPWGWHRFLILSVHLLWFFLDWVSHREVNSASRRRISYKFSSKPSWDILIVLNSFKYI